MELSFGSVWRDMVGLGNTFLENQTETRETVPDPAKTTAPPVNAVDSSGKSMDAQDNPAAMLKSLPLWLWLVIAFVVVLLIALLIKVF